MGNIQMEKLSLGYKDKIVLRDVNLEIDDGDFVLVCGETAGGKSTLLKKIKEMLGLKAAFVLQNPNSGLVCDKVLAELEFNLQCLGEKADKIKARVAECAGFFGISKWLSRDVSTLSGGEKQTLSIAAAMTMNPEVLILDEPTSLLDPIMTERLLETIFKINREYGITVIISEHKPDRLFEYATKVVFVNNGTAKIGSRDDMAKYFLSENKFEGYVPVVTRLFYKYNKNELIYSVAKGRSCYRNLSEEERKKIEENIFVNQEDNNKENIVFEAKNLVFGYEKYNPILNNINFSIREGEIVALLGENGCGKSTLAMLAAGSKRPFSGKIMINKKEVKRPEDGAGILFQDSTLHFVQDEYDGKHPYDLSGGERQKLALRLVLKNNPKTLVLDEPSKGLDPVEKRKFMDKINELSKEGVAVLIITHDIELASELSHRMMLMHGGEIVVNEATKEFVKNNIFYTTIKSRIIN